MKNKKLKKRLLWSIVIVFILMNIVTAYKFTHLITTDTAKKIPYLITLGEQDKNVSREEIYANPTALKN